MDIEPTELTKKFQYFCSFMSFMKALDLCCINDQTSNL